MLTKFQLFCSEIFAGFSELNKLATKIDVYLDEPNAFNDWNPVSKHPATKEDLDLIVAGYQEEFKTNLASQAAAKFLGV